MGNVGGVVHREPHGDEDVDGGDARDGDAPPVHEPHEVDDGEDDGGDHPNGDARVRDHDPLQHAPGGARHGGWASTEAITMGMDIVRGGRGLPPLPITK